MLVLGAHSSHDASACLLRDGEILVAIEKERLVRSKHATGYASLQDVVAYCLDFVGVSLSEVDHIVVQDATHRLGETLIDPREVRLGHHAAHAWAAVGMAGFEEAAVLVIDCEGSFLKELGPEERAVCTQTELHCAEKESAYVFEKGDLRAVRKWTSSVSDSIMTGTDGLGAVYWFLSQLIFGRDQNDSKVMGLAAYSAPDDKYGGVLCPGPDGAVHVSKDWIFNLDHLPRGSLEEGFETYAALTATVQHELEAAILHKAQWLRSETGMTKLCYAGGVALNCVANSKLVQANIFDSVFVPFGAGDSSLSLGCAYFAHRKLGSTVTKRQWKSRPTPYLGRTYEPTEVDAQLSVYQGAGLLSEGAPLDLDAVAGRIADGAIVGWFQGRSEFGPRALGNRSLLADPRRAEIRENLNRKVKLREPYRPFGAAVMQDHADKLFDCIPADARYMQFVASVRSDRRSDLAAIVHRDGSCRAQLVDRASNPELYALLNRFRDQTGVPALLNTSFNIAEPIVESPQDAAKCFICSGIDLLAIGARMYHRTAALISDETELAAIPDSSLRIVFHHDVELISRGANAFAVQPLTGREVFNKEGYRMHQYRIDEQPVSRLIFETLTANKPGAHTIDATSDLIRNPAARSEAFRTLHCTRILSFVRISPPS